MCVLRDFESCSRYSSPAITWLAAKEVKRTFLRATILVLKLQTSNDHSFCCEFSPMRKMLPKNDTSTMDYFTTSSTKWR